MKKCEWCGCEFSKRKSKTSRESSKMFAKRRFCSIPCRLKWQKHWYTTDNPSKYFDNSGENNPMFGKHGANFNPEGNARRDGYVRVTVNKKRILKHRLVMEQKLSRELQTWEIVHHIDGNPSNNNPDNLELMTQSEHAGLHASLGRKFICDEN